MTAKQYPSAAEASGGKALSRHYFKIPGGEGFLRRNFNFVAEGLPVLEVGPVLAGAFGDVLGRHLEHVGALWQAAEHGGQLLAKAQAFANLTEGRVVRPGHKAVLQRLLRMEEV